jgi:hypothetical protein
MQSQTGLFLWLRSGGSAPRDGRPALLYIMEGHGSLTTTASLRRSPPHRPFLKVMLEIQSHITAVVLRILGARSAKGQFTISIATNPARIRRRTTIGWGDVSNQGS